jgi:dihydrofolate reductase
MTKLQVFNSISLDGYFTGENGDLSWAHKGADDPEWTEFVSGNAQGGGALLMGRVTYDMMAAFWPTKEAMKQMPEVAKGMTGQQKYVFSRTRTESDWENTTFLSGDPAAEAARLKTGGGPGITILGSGSIVAELAAADLIDAYTFVVVPVVIGKGRTMFEGVRNAPELKLTGTRTFHNGRVVLNYEAT